MKGEHRVPALGSVDCGPVEHANTTSIAMGTVALSCGQRAEPQQGGLCSLFDSRVRINSPDCSYHCRLRPYPNPNDPPAPFLLLDSSDTSNYLI
uniref:Uncharacterized protein n=1 Tax=Eucalyptus grandis TaxID=71139 RepID=A0A059BSC9_EUCGR